jgi:hypothetical protein
MHPFSVFLIRHALGNNSVCVEEERKQLLLYNVITHI